ncbi:hypothetical protein DGWBC_0060 [Dehalogenimonas sp. WBC-2]|nr:hypothetical protein DGWBC_0060 [Dehalogenimonas sp. WBC-2]
MQFRKRFLMVFMSLALLAGMLGGGTVAAADTKLSWESISNGSILTIHLPLSQRVR